jgi:GAF domain-containing protein
VTRPRNPKLPLLVTLDPSHALAAEGASSRLKGLFEFGRRMLEQTDPAQVMGAMHQAIVEHLQPERACLLRLARDGSVHPLAGTRIDLFGPVESWPVSHAVLRKVRDTGLAVLATDVSQEAELPSGGPQKLKLRSVLCAPLSREPVRGVLYLDSREGHGRTYHRDDLDFLAALSVLASLMLDRTYGNKRTADALHERSTRVAALEDELRRLKGS